jgi:hypothetical protein
LTAHNASLRRASRHSRSPSMFDLVWLALILGLFGVGLAYLVGCDQV